MLRGGYGHHVAVGVDDVDLGSGGAEGVRDDVAGNGGTSEENALAGDFAPLSSAIWAFLPGVFLWRDGDLQVQR